MARWSSTASGCTKGSTWPPSAATRCAPPMTGPWSRAGAGSTTRWASRLAGRVLRAMKNKMYELPIVVIIDDGNGYRSVYAHLGQATVKIGDASRQASRSASRARRAMPRVATSTTSFSALDGPWMQLSPDLVKRDHYPPQERERIDPFRVLSMHEDGHPRLHAGRRSARRLAWARPSDRLAARAGTEGCCRRGREPRSIGILWAWDLHGRRCWPRRCSLSCWSAWS